MKKHSQQFPFLLQLETDQLDITRIREQRQLVTKIQSALAKKDKQIQSLKALLEKYQHFQQKYSSLKVELAQKSQLITRKDEECRLLRKQLEEMVKEGQQTSVRTRQWQAEKQQLIRERHAIERTTKETQRTFKQYQTECRRRQQQLLQDLERAYQTHKEQNAKIDQLEIELEGINTLKSRIKQLQKELEEKHITKEHTPAHRAQLTQSEDLSNEVMRLQQELLRKEQHISKQKMLNYELTVEYDRTVSALCALESEVSSYRRENSELKQTLNLMRESQQSHQLQQKYVGRQTRVLSKKGFTPQSVKQQDDSQYQFENEMNDEIPTMS